MASFLPNWLVAVINRETKSGRKDLGELLARRHKGGLEKLEDRMLLTAAPANGLGSPVAYPVGTTPDAITAGDFDADGNLDIVVTNRSGNSVTMIAGASNGAFGSPVTYGVGLSPDALAARDFNGDGKLDLAVANRGGGNVTILLNNGTGGLVLGGTYAVGSTPDGIAAGDFDGDGDADLAVINRTGNTASILRNTGEGAFAAATTTAVGATPEGLVVGDFNGDGDLDLATANRGANDVTIMTGNGDRTFDAPVHYAVGTFPTALARGDLNGDGYQDLVVANRGSNNISVLSNDGSGAFAAAVNYNFGTAPAAVAIGDVNGDGKFDVVVANSGSSNISVRTGVGNGALNSATNMAVGTTPQGVIARNLNGDGLSDVAVTNNGASSVSVLLGEGLTASGTAVTGVEGASVANATVAHFSHSDPGSAPSDFIATINWGDGTTENGTIVADEDGGFRVKGTHTYADFGGYNTAVTVEDSFGHMITVTSTAAIADAAAHIAGVAVSATEGSSTGTVPVATFTDDNPNGVAGDWAATIDWGDGSAPEAGTVVDLGGGDFVVRGAHTYRLAIDRTITVSLAGTGGGATASDTAAATVADTAISLTANDVSVTEGQSTGTITIASFSDANPLAVIGDYTATIDWGDGTSPTTGLVVADGNGGYDVTTTGHTYHRAIDRTITVTIDDGDSTTASNTAAATVADAVIVVTVDGPTLDEGESTGTIDIASFTDGNPLALNKYDATINWGDGSAPEAGTIASDGNGGYLVQGSHTYRHSGTASVTVTVTDVDGATDSDSDNAIVNDYPISVTGVDVTATEAAATGAVTVATFTDADPTAVAGDYTAVIDWGDGSATSAGTVSGNASDGFVVKGSHTYALYGPYTVTTTVAETGDTSTDSDTSDATVADAAAHITAVDVSATAGTTTGTITVANFTDDNPNGVAADWTASINWGDGTAPSAGTVSDDGDGGFIVEGAHTFRKSVDRTVTVTLTGVGGATASDTSDATVADTTLAVMANGVSVTEGTTTGTVTVATFTDTNTLAVFGDYTATIDWGDDTTPDTGTVSSDGHGGYVVEGAHTYHRAIDRTVTVTVTDSDGTIASDTAAATVADEVIVVTADGPTVNEGASTGTIDVATFTDGNPLAVNRYDATINWGDGSAPEAGVIASDGNGGFVVRGAHTYRHSGTPSVSVTVTDADGATDSDSDNATVNDRTISATGVDVEATEAASTGAVTVATFTDPDPTAVAGDYTAVIDWGDGTATSAGTVSGNASDGFVVKGSHTYALYGPYTVSVSIAETGDSSTASTTSDATVADAAAHITSVAEISATAGTTTGTLTVATFTDDNPNGVAADWTASINWGDGTAPSAGTVSDDGDGGFVVEGAHTFRKSVDRTVTVTLTGVGGATASDSAEATVADTAIGVVAQDVSATEGQATGTITVATFTDVNALALSGDYTATIDWGDDTSPSTGTVSDDGHGGFVVLGDHTFGRAIDRVVTVTITDSDGTIASDTSDATVADAAIVVTGGSLTVNEGAPTGTVTVATFTDGNPLDEELYDAQIDWGDGSSPSTGTVVEDGNGGFVVKGSHTYTHSGTPTVTVSVTDADGATDSDTFAATVNDRTISATGVDVAAVEGAGTGSVTVATFTDADPTAAAGDYTATINWGDGSGPSAGTITGNAQDGFVVKGTHTYATFGTRTVTVNVAETGDTSTAQATASAVVADADAHLTGSPFSATAGTTTGTVTVATFTDDNPNGVAGNWTANINWGDGTMATPGTVIADGHGGFLVRGAHTYRKSVNRTAIVVVTGNGGAIASTTAAATVADTALDVTANDVSATEGQSTGAITIASFTDANTLALAGDYTVSINWGDGTGPTAGVVVADGGGAFHVTSTGHTYARAIDRTVTVTVTDSDGTISSDTSSATVANAAIVVTGGSLTVNEGAPTGTVTVATFTDGNPLAANLYTATINWGDGTGPTAGVVSADGMGGFIVSGGHTYRHSGSPTVTVTVTDADNGTDTDTFTATVTDRTIDASGVDVTGTEGASTGAVTVATFTDADPTAAAGDYTAQIHWGDSTSSAGTVASDGHGGFVVTSTGHTYAAYGHHTVTVDIAETGDTSTAQATSDATVADAAAHITAQDVEATAGTTTGTVTVATFTDDNPAGVAGDWTASINWGDGTAPSAGSVSGDGHGGFIVEGAHTYRKSVDRTVTVSLTGNGGATASDTSDATVADTTLSVTASDVEATEGADTGTITVATFTDANTLAQAGDYTVSINWGDDSDPTAGLVVADGGGAFHVTSAGHTYARAIDRTVTVTVTDSDGTIASDTSSATVADAAINITPNPQTYVEGAAADVSTIASFTDANPLAANLYTATINWGDGTDPTTGQVFFSSGHNFVVRAGHTYAHSGHPTVTITVTDVDGGTDTDTFTANVTDRTISATGVDVTAVEGAPTGPITVATFTDPDPTAVAGDYTALINWGDGSPASAGTISADSAGHFRVRGAHAYTAFGDYTVTVSIAETDDTSTAQATSDATVSDAAAHVTAIDLDATEGVDTGTITVATFVDDNPSGVAEDWTATINWGDGTSPTPGLVVSDGDGEFHVTSAGHTFARNTDRTITVTVANAQEHEVSDTASATVAAQDIIVVGTDIEATEGSSTGLIDVAGFVDGNSLTAAGDYTATIDWGDESDPTTGVIVSDGDGGFTVRGSHTYASSGERTVSVTVLSDDGDTDTGTLTATVASAVISTTGLDFTVNEGATTGNKTLVTFTDANPLTTAGDYTATIDWGDDSEPTTGVVSSNAGSGWRVKGSHTYRTGGNRDVTVTIDSSDGDHEVVELTATVAPVAIVVTAPNRSLTQGTSTGTVNVATFTNANPLAVAGDFEATIDWGDGSDPDTGTVVSDGGGAYRVRGSHTYASVGAFTASVTVDDVEDGSSGDDPATVTVANAAFAGTGTPITSTRARLFGGVVAHFTDANPLATIGDYTATITWGDGNTSTGTVVAHAGGGYDVTGTNVYALPGTFTAHVDISDGDGGAIHTTATATVRNPKYFNFPLQGTGSTISAIRSRTFTGAVATLTNPYPSYATGDLTGVINWGDGKTSAATFVKNPSGTYAVRGSHAYAAVGTFKVTATVTDVFARTTAIKGTAKVTKGAASGKPRKAPRSPVASAAGTDFTVQRNRRVTRQVAHFTVANSAWAASDFDVVVNWGDGQTSAGTVAANAGGGFDVTGQHRYAARGTYEVSVTITNPDDSVLHAQATATVKRNKLLGIV